MIVPTIDSTSSLETQSGTLLEAGFAADSCDQCVAFPHLGTSSPSTVRISVPQVLRRTGHGNHTGWLYSGSGQFDVGYTGIIGMNAYFPLWPYDTDFTW